MTIESPCVRQCRLDEARTHCVACQRTLDEIRGWKDADDNERAAILERIASLKPVATRVGA